MSKPTVKLVSALLATSILATGCSVGHEANRNIRTTTSEAGGLLPTAAQPMAAADTSPVKVKDGVYVGTRSVRNENGDPLPSRFETNSGITLVRTNPVGLREIATAITEFTKIPVVLGTSPAAGTPAAQSSAPTPQFAQGPMPADFPMAEALSQISAVENTGASASAGGSVSAASNVAPPMPVNYSGPLSGLLDVVTAQFDVAWKYERGRIVVEPFITRSFDVPALAMATSMDFSLSSKSEQQASEQGGAQASSGQEASSKTETNIIQEITEALQVLVPGDASNGSSFAINKSTGVVTVTGSPALVSRVSDYLSSLNQRLAKQIALSVKVYSVSLNDGEAFNLDVKGLFEKAGQYAITGGGAGGAASAVQGGTPGLGWALLDTGSRWEGTEALVSALSSRGDVSVVTTASVTTVSGVPVPLQVGEQRDYMRKVEVITDSEGNQTASLEPGTVSTGFSLQINPRVERNGDILVQYGINISELTGAEDGFDTYESMGSMVQLRRINQRNFIQQARIPNNNTLVLAGFEQVRNESKKRGVGRANFPLFGGGAESRMQREIIVIMITPTLLRAG